VRSRKHILVTGGLGFIGSNLIEELSKDDDNFIYSLDNNFTANTCNRVYRDNVEYIYSDTRDISRTMRHRYVNVVFHLGEYSRIVPSFDDIDEIHDFNVKGTFSVLRFCTDRNIKLIYAASSSKFGDVNNQYLSPYAWIKAKNVELIKNFSDWFGLRFSIAYFYNVYGDRQIMSGKYSAVIGRFMDQYMKGEKLTVVYPGTQRRDFTNVRDIVKGLSLLIDDGDGEEFQFGTGKNYSIVEIAEAFDSEYDIIPERVGERFEGRATKNDTTNSIGWRVEIDVIDYIKEFVKNHKK
jgi:UDP-glucose 4-epimerase